MENEGQGKHEKKTFSEIYSIRNGFLCHTTKELFIWHKLKKNLETS